MGKSRASSDSLAKTSRGSLRRGYVAIWAVAGMVSATYVGYGATNPRTLPTDKAEAMLGSFAKGVAELKSDVGTLKSRIAKLETVKGAAAKPALPVAPAATLPAGGASRPDDPAKRAGPAKAAGAPPATATKTGTAPVPTRRGPKDKLISISTPPAKVSPSGDVVLSVIKPEDTGTKITGFTVAPKAAAPADLTFETSLTGPQALDPVPLPTRRVVGLDIAQGPSPDALRLSWDLLNETHRELLASLKTKYVRQAGGEKPYRLVAGPFNNEAEAKRLCKTLEESGNRCALTIFAGENF